MIYEQQYGFGRKPSPIDLRDYHAIDYIPKKAIKRMLSDAIKEINWAYLKESLDQENTGHCCGFSMANFGINLPKFTDYDNEDGHKFYYLCKVEDGEPNNEDGSYIRTAGKVLRNRNIISTYAFAKDIAEIKWWILNRGSVIVGTPWTSDMLMANESNIVRISGQIVGGHAYLLVGIKEINGKEYFIIQNSWGKSWGIDGRAYISVEDFKILFAYGGEALATLENVEKKSDKINQNLIGLILEWIIGLFKK